MTDIQLQSLIDVLGAMGLCIMCGLGYLAALMP